MSEAKQRDQWDHTSDLLALLANCHKAEETEPFSRSSFHPFHQSEEKQEPDIQTDDITILKPLYQ